MSRFLDILDNHRELLHERGYSEIDLGTPDQPGLFMKKLEYLFSECCRKAGYDQSKQDFIIEAYGFFNNDKDIVRFQFHYEFDPAPKDITLKSFSAHMDGINKTFLIGPNMYHLMRANQVHETLHQERELREQATIRPTANEQIKKITQLIDAAPHSPGHSFRKKR